MLLTTILNQCYRFKGFVYGQARLVRHRGRQSIEVGVRPRTGSRARCSGCGVRCAGYDHLPERRFEFIPLWGFPVFLVYARRRVDCPARGIVAEKIPWAEGKHHLTRATCCCFPAGPGSYPGGKCQRHSTPPGSRYTTRLKGWCSGVHFCSHIAWPDHWLLPGGACLRGSGRVPSRSARNSRTVPAAPRGAGPAFSRLHLRASPSGIFFTYRRPSVPSNLASASAALTGGRSVSTRSSGALQLLRRCRHEVLPARERALGVDPARLLDQERARHAHLEVRHWCVLDLLRREHVWVQEGLV